MPTDPATTGQCEPMHRTITWRLNSSEPLPADPVVLSLCFPAVLLQMRTIKLLQIHVLPIAEPSADRNTIGTHLAMLHPSLKRVQLQQCCRVVHISGYANIFADRTGLRLLLATSGTCCLEHVPRNGTNTVRDIQGTSVLDR